MAKETTLPELFCVFIRVLKKYHCVCVCSMLMSREINEDGTEKRNVVLTAISDARTLILC